MAAARPFDFESTVDRLNHNVFRYPAKFHPPVARRLIEEFSKPGETILDPFCGSGTTLVEALVAGRSSVGIDVDPLAAFVADAKVRQFDSAALIAANTVMKDRLDVLRRKDEERWGSFLNDISADIAQERMRADGLTAPALPKIDHWFRYRVVHQLATIRREIDAVAHNDARLFLMLCFAAIIRGSSNADPVPVSGLEVTSHMLAKEAQGREIDPYQLFKRAIDRIAAATAALAAVRSPSATARMLVGDARTLTREQVGDIDAVITSPPYLTAVDYYRRHTLEMYWLGLTQDHNQRLDLMPRYIGRDRVGIRHLPDPAAASASLVADRWLERFPGLKSERARAFRHYCDGMSRSLARMVDVVKPGGRIVIVAGDVRFSGQPVSMLQLMSELAGERLELVDHLWYAIKNRFMSYTRKNEANIAADHVIVFGRKSGHG